MLPPIVSDMIRVVRDKTASQNHRENAAAQLMNIHDQAKLALDSFQADMEAQAAAARRRAKKKPSVRA